MESLLTGIQSTGVPHLGNILGAMLPATNLCNQYKISFLFIANLHSLTQIKDPILLKNNTLSVAATFLALGLDPQKTIFYKQSDIPEITELSWYLSCFFSFKRLTLAHSFKDKSNTLSEINAGLFNYPILMTADILLFKANKIPVGKDQLQHIEIARDIASIINNYNEKLSKNKLHNNIYSKEKPLKLPESLIQENTNYILGTDGRKMSKSYNNTINIFEQEKILKKQIMSIKTDSLDLESPKNSQKCIVFNIYSLLADKKDVKIMEEKYKKGGYGYGSAKKRIIKYNS